MSEGTPRKHTLKSFRNDELSKYITEKSLRLTKGQEELYEATLKLENGKIMGDPIVLQLNANLMKLIGAKKVLDIGVFTGASSLAAALAIPEDGKVYAFDITDEYFNKIGKRILKEEGVASKVELTIGPAVENLKKLIDNGHSGTFDFSFIDADKVNNDNYYEMSLTLLRPGGVIAIDNTLQRGRVFDPECNSENVECVRKLNDKLKNDERIYLSFLGVGDGLTLCFKIK